MEKTQGQLDYEADCAERPNYQDGTPRKTWAQLSDIARDSWERGARNRINGQEQA